MKETTLLSFHGKQEVKDFYVNRVKAHFEADEIIKGTYWEKGRGCGIGCTIHDSKHDNYDTELGITWRLALLEDSLFEKLPNGEAKKFPLQFLQSMPIGVDTNLIFKKFMIWNLLDKKEGLADIVKDKKYGALLKEIGETYQKSLKEEISVDVWKELANRAYAYASASASASASAYAYAYAYASASAYAYAYASAYASAYAYASASAYASTEWKERFDERILRMRDKLLQLIETAKP